MASRYVLQIADMDSGEVVVTWPPRKPETDGPVIDALCARLTEKGVGLGTTAAHVCDDLRAVWAELLTDLKGAV